MDSSITVNTLPCIPGANDCRGELPARLVLLLAAAAGLSVASLYYAQPILGELAAQLGATPHQIGWVPTLTQLGYALGLLLLAPLGDRFDRRRIILAKCVVLVVALLATATAPHLGVLLAAALLTGLAATLAQDIVPAAATLAPEASRGRTVGMVMTGLLLGVLLSRVVSGVASQWIGWRSMFLAAALVVALLGLALWRGLPRFAPTTRLAYGALLGSLVALWRQHPALRRAALAQGALAVGFSAFWSTLAVMLHGAPFHLGSAAAGAFGLAGAAGALAAPLAGRLSDRRGPEHVTRIGALVVLLAFGAMLAMPLLPTGAQLGLMVASALAFDLGFQSTLVAHQTLVYGIDAGARSRLNAVLFVGMFTGMALGAALGSLALAQWGWPAVTALAVLSAAFALAVRMWPQRAGSPA